MKDTFDSAPLSESKHLAKLVSSNSKVKECYNLVLFSETNTYSGLVRELSNESVLLSDSKHTLQPAKYDS